MISSRDISPRIREPSSMHEGSVLVQRPSALWDAENPGTARLGKYAVELKRADQSIRGVHTSPATRRVEARSSSLEERLFESKSKAKQLTALIAMHLHRGWRDSFFRQVDNLLDADEWDDRDIPVVEASFRTFLRLIIFLKAEIRPGLSATSNGELMATWRNGDSRLTVYCRPFDQLRWVARKPSTGDQTGPEMVAGETTISRLPNYLASFGSLSEWGFRK
jgi:hypothetical protein